MQKQNQKQRISDNAPRTYNAVNVHTQGVVRGRNDNVAVIQSGVGNLLRVVEADLDRRGVLMLDRAQQLLTSVKRAKLTMSLSEQMTPASFLNAKWRQQAEALQRAEIRLSRIIRGVRIPTKDERPTTHNQRAQRHAS